MAGKIFVRERRKVEKGEKIGDYLVLEIEEKRVVLKKGDKEFVLKLEEEGK